MVCQGRRHHQHRPQQHTASPAARRWLCARPSSSWHLHASPAVPLHRLICGAAGWPWLGTSMPPRPRSTTCCRPGLPPCVPPRRTIQEGLVQVVVRVGVDGWSRELDVRLWKVMRQSAACVSSKPRVQGSGRGTVAQAHGRQADNPASGHERSQLFRASSPPSSHAGDTKNAGDYCHRASIHHCGALQRPAHAQAGPTCHPAKRQAPVVFYRPRPRPRPNHQTRLPLSASGCRWKGRHSHTHTRGVASGGTGCQTLLAPAPRCCRGLQPGRRPRRRRWRGRRCRSGGGGAADAPPCAPSMACACRGRAVAAAASAAADAASQRSTVAAASGPHGRPAGAIRGRLRWRRLALLLPPLLMLWACSEPCCAGAGGSGRGALRCFRCTCCVRAACVPRLVAGTRCAPAPGGMGREVSCIGTLLVLRSCVPREGGGVIF